MLGNGGVVVGQSHGSQVFSESFPQGAVGFSHVKLVAEAAADDIDDVRGQASEGGADSEGGFRSNYCDRWVDVCAAMAFFFIAGMVAGRVATGVFDSCSDQQVFEAGVTFVGQKRGQGEDFLELSIRLQHVEVAENDVFDGDVVKVICEDQDGPI